MSDVLIKILEHPILASAIGTLIALIVYKKCSSFRKIKIILDKYEPKSLRPNQFQWYLAFVLTNESSEIRYIDKDHFYYTNNNEKDKPPTILPIIPHSKYPIKLQENESCKIEIDIFEIGRYKDINNIFITDTKKRTWDIEKNSLKDFQDKTQKFFDEYKTIEDDFIKITSLR